MASSSKLQVGGLRVRKATPEDLDEFGVDWVQPNRENIVAVKTSRRGYQRNRELVGVSAFDPRKKELTQLWVSPKHRRQGIATKMMAAHGDVQNVMAAKRPGARKFYEQQGFVQSGKAGPKQTPMRKQGAPQLKTELLEHQQRVVNRIKQQPGLVVAHGTGSGKTLSSIGAIVDLAPTKARVIVPASLKENYRKEIKKHVKGKLPVEVESLQKAVRDGRPPRGDMLVVDEAHRVRNPQSKGYQLLGQSPAGKRLLMTASPVYNKPEDVAPLVNLAAGRKELPVGSDFDRRFVQKPSKGLLAVINPFAQKEPKLVREKELGKVLNKWVDYHGGNDKGFPALEEKRVDVPMNERQARLHAHAWGELPMMTKLRLARGLPPAKEDLPRINQFQAQTRQLSSSERKYSTDKPELSPKLRTAVDNLVAKSEKDPKHKAVVYANYLGTLDDYSEELDKRKVPHVTFRGDTPKKVREQAVRDLNAGKVKALLVSGAGGEGLDLKGVRQVQVLEPHWNDEKLRQVVGRARRYGSHDHLPPKDRKVEVERYAAHMKGMFGVKKPGVEGMLYDMSDQKQRLNKQVLDLMAKEGMMQKVAGRVLGPIPYDPRMLKTASSFERELDRQVDLAQENLRKLPKFKRILSRKLKDVTSEAAERAGRVVGLGG